ncbi:MAG: hypothetical protein WC352_00455 [Candidatus Omnitrophota bacterium]|jgi:tRNA/tmRNA/rRNA uracil-C5-methylase (TrmA/RlmC/RlmD family)
MLTTENSQEEKVLCIPKCPVFGVCGGCSFQNIPYGKELALKEGKFRELFRSELGLAEDVFDPIEASPLEYHYRSRLDLTLRRFKTGELVMGFQCEDTHRMVPVESCPIARAEISDFLPELRRQAEARMPPDYRIANLTVRTDDSGRVSWGGIGRHSCRMKPEDYFYTVLGGRRFFFSLDTFFQANLSILPKLMAKLEPVVCGDPATVFLDLYAGVGLFGYYFAGKVRRVVMVESSADSLMMMKYNRAYGGHGEAEIFEGRVEEAFAAFLGRAESGRRVALIDPPRKGLSFEAADALSDEKGLAGLLYLSCSTASLVRDLRHFVRKGWVIRKLTPFDFFPKTPHLETLAYLEPGGEG